MALSSTYSMYVSGFVARATGWSSIVDPIPVELRATLDQVMQAVNAKLYYPALAVTLSLPDICTNLASAPDNPRWLNRRTYEEWCEQNLDRRFKNFSGHDMYNIRGGVLHRGNFEHDQSRFARVFFVGPESPITFHDVLIKGMEKVSIADRSAEELKIAGDVLVMGVVPFCLTVISSVEEWYKKNKENSSIKANLERLVRFRAEGIPPIFVDVPVIG